MYPSEFEFFEPSELNEALELLKDHDEGKILAGGQSLIPLLKARIADIPALISISRIPDMSYIKNKKDHFAIGSMTIDSDIEFSSEIKAFFPILHEAVTQLADPLIRNIGTVGGNISHGDPSNDLPSVTLALGATMKVIGPGGYREIPSDKFFVDTFHTAMERDEILTEIMIPVWGDHSGGAYVKSKKGTSDFSIATVAAQIELDGDTCKRIGLAMSSVAPKPVRARKAEEFLAGKRITEELIEEASLIVLKDANPSSDLMGSREFKLKILQKIAGESISKAYQRAMGA